MREPGAWVPTKFERRGGELRASRRHVGYGSRLMVDRLATVYQRMIRQHATGALVDLGCGAAPLYLEYRELVSGVTLVDWESSAYPNPCIDVHCDLNHEVPLPSACADTVLATDVLEHLYRPEAFLAECARLLRPGGKLLLGVPFLFYVHEAPHDYHRYTEHRLQQLVRGSGLRLVELEPIGGPIDVILDVSAKLASRSAVLRAMHRLGGGALALLSRAWRPDPALARSFPLAYALVATREGAPPAS